MGDIIEFTSKANLEALFYTVTTGAIRFSVKKLNGGAAAVLLSTTPGLENAYWIIIGFENSCYIQKQGKQSSKVQVPNILVQDEYKDFWVAWNNGTIRLGQGNNTKPLITKKIIEQNLLFMAFIGSSWETRLQWKVLLPPQIEKPVPLRLKGGEPRWVRPGDQLPDDSIIGGFEKEIIYIIRAPHANSLTPGKFVPSEGVGYLAWGGGMHEKNEFEVLCGYNYMWVPTKFDEIPFGAVVAGYSEDHRHENLYVGRVKLGDHIIPGKVQASHKVCYVAYDGREKADSTYEILVVPCLNTHNEHANYISNFSLPRHHLELHNDSESNESEDDDDDDDDMAAEW